MKQCLYIILLLFPFSVFGNNYTTTQQYINIDSLLTELKYTNEDTNKVHLLNEIGKEYSLYNADSSIIFSEIALELSTKLNFKNGLKKSFFLLGFAYSQKAYNNLAVEFLKKSLKICETQNDNKTKISCLNLLGIIKEINGEFDEALMYFTELIILCEKTGKKESILRCYNNIGNVYYRTGNYDKALEYYQKSYQICNEINYQSGKAFYYNNVGIIYLDKKEYTKALNYFNNSLQLELKGKNSRSVAVCYVNIGDVYREINNFKSAHEYYEKALEIRTRINDKHGIASVLFSIGKLYNSQKKYELSTKYFLESIKKSKKIDVAELKKKIYKEISENYADNNEYKKAFKYYKLYKKTNDSIFNENKSKQFAEIQLQYETEQMEKEIDLLNAKNKIKEKQSLILAAIVITLIIFGILLIYFLRVKNISFQQKNLLLEKEKLIDKLALEKNEFENQKKEAENLRLQEEMNANEQINLLKEEKYKDEINHKNRELATSALQIVNKNEILNNIKETLEEDISKNKPIVSNLIKKIENNIRIDKDWDKFKVHFEEVHHGFFERLKQNYPSITTNEQKLCAYLRINLDSKEISRTLNISLSALEKRRYRLRKKLNLCPEENIINFLIKF